MVQLPANLSVIIQIVLFVLGAYFFALYLGLLIWTWRDIRARSRDLLVAFLSLLLILLFNLPGLLLYMVLRPKDTLSEVYARDLEEEALLQEIEDRHTCPECERRVEPDFMLCPWCHTGLRNRCLGCGRLLNQRWEVCPYCGEEVPPSVETVEIVEAIAEEGSEEAELPGDDIVAVAFDEDEPMEGEIGEAD